MEEHDELLRRVREPDHLRPERRRKRVWVGGWGLAGGDRGCGGRATPAGCPSCLERVRQLDDSLAVAKGA